MLNDKFDSDLLQPLDSDEFLPPMSRWTMLSGLFLVGTLVGAIALSAFTKYNITVKASGMVRPASDMQTIAAATQGTLKSIEVNENQVVKTGDAIARVDDTPLKQQQSQLSKQADQLKLDLLQLKAQVNQYVSTSGKTATQLANLNGPAALLIQRCRKVEDQFNSTQKNLNQVTQMLNNSIIRAPVAGTILKLEVQNTGQPVKLGDNIAQIVPSDRPVVVKARVAVQDIGNVEVGQPVQLRVSSYPYPDYGTLKGKVSAIAPDATTPTSSGDGATTSYYEVNVQPDQSYLVRSDRKYFIQPGMEVTADIISREETVLQFILRKARLLTDL